MDPTSCIRDNIISSITELTDQLNLINAEGRNADFANNRESVIHPEACVNCDTISPHAKPTDMSDPANAEIKDNEPSAFKESVVPSKANIDSSEIQSTTDKTSTYDKSLFIGKNTITTYVLVLFLRIIYVKLTRLNSNRSF
jgi:hypothetical protein